jgi:hypothetical protein
MAEPSPRRPLGKALRRTPAQLDEASKLDTPADVIAARLMAAGTPAEGFMEAKAEAPKEGA